MHYEVQKMMQMLRVFLIWSCRILHENEMEIYIPTLEKKKLQVEETKKVLSKIEIESESIEFMDEEKKID